MLLWHQVKQLAAFFKVNKLAASTGEHITGSGMAGSFTAF